MLAIETKFSFVNYTGFVIGIEVDDALKMT